MIRQDIAVNALRVWSYLHQYEGEVSVVKIQEDLNLEFEACCLSIGWLSKEDKIFIAFRGDEMYIMDLLQLSTVLGFNG